MAVLFNGTFGAIALAAAMLLALDVAELAAVVLPGRGWPIPFAWRYAIAITAALMAAVAVRQAVRVPPLKDATVTIASPRLISGCEPVSRRASAQAPENAILDGENGVHDRA